MEQNPVLACREILKNCTPLETDCGQFCKAACCHSLPEEETGMLLFPGEETYYQGLSGWRIVRTASGNMIVCDGSCKRDDRPLSCRLFPLLPLIRDDAVRVAMDARAAAVCPLYRSGASGLRKEFVEAVRTCGQILAADPTQLQFLRHLTIQHDELRSLQRSFGR